MVATEASGTYSTGMHSCYKSKITSKLRQKATNKVPLNHLRNPGSARIRGMKLEKQIAQRDTIFMKGFETSVRTWLVLTPDFADCQLIINVDKVRPGTCFFNVIQRTCQI